MQESYLKAIHQIFFDIESRDIAVAVSGGADSIALMHMVYDYFYSTNLFSGKILHVLTVDHGLRRDSAFDAHFVINASAALGIEGHVLHWRHGGVKANIHHKARFARYDLMTKYCKENNIKYLLTAHNADEQVETFMMRILRGSGLDGLSCIRSVTTVNGITILRPLLQCPKSCLLQYLADRSIGYVEDPSNLNPRFTRTFYRKILKFFNHNLIRKRLLLTINHIRRASDALNFFTDKAMREYTYINDVGDLIMSRDCLTELPQEIILRMLIVIISRKRINLHTNYDNIYNIYNKLTKEVTSSFNITGYTVRCEVDVIVFSAKSIK